MKDHEIQEMVSKLRDIAVTYGRTQQLRERIHSAIVPKLKEPRNRMNIRCPFVDIFEIRCVYMTQYMCQDIRICPGNGDSWCLRSLGANDENKKRIIIAYSAGYEHGHHDTVEGSFSGNGRNEEHDYDALEWFENAEQEGTFDRDLSCEDEAEKAKLLKKLNGELYALIEGYEEVFSSYSIDPKYKELIEVIIKLKNKLD